MAEERVVGIDLGTTNSLVAFMQGEKPVVIPGEDGLNLVPSVVALQPARDGGRPAVMVGNEARRTLLEAPERAIYSVKRLMGRGLEDVTEELKLFPSAWPTKSSPGKCSESASARLNLRRPRFRRTSCASSNAMPKGTSGAGHASRDHRACLL